MFCCHTVVQDPELFDLLQIASPRMAPEGLSRMTRMFCSKTGSEKVTAGWLRAIPAPPARTAPAVTPSRDLQLHRSGPHPWPRHTCTHPLRSGCPLPWRLPRRRR